MDIIGWVRASSFRLDLAERAVKTFVQAVLATFVFPAATHFYELAAWKGAAITAALVGFSAVFSLISRSVGDRRTASLVDTRHQHRHRLSKWV